MRWLFLSFALLVAPMVQAASFDCAKAVTDIEIAICSDPELSLLDEEMAHVYGQLAKPSKYYRYLRDDQRAWLSDDRTDSQDVFQQRLNYLHAFMVLATCFDGADDPQDCLVNERDMLEICMSDGNYTTYAMDSCSAAMAGAWDAIMAIESDLKRQALEDDPDTLMIFDEAGDAFEAYRQTECGWQYSEYRGGTIRGQIWFGCYLDLTSRRVISLIHGNQLF